MANQETAAVRYRNPWHKPDGMHSGPEFYETNAKPQEHRGYLMYERVPGTTDIVKDGVCVTQRGAKPSVRMHGEIDLLILNYPETRRNFFKVTEHAQAA